MASRPIETLMNEHRVIEQVLGCLEKMLQQAERDGSLDGESAQQAADFFRVFADHCHHAKEEHQLFPALEARGMPREGSPTAVMRYEHDQGRAAVAQMAATCEAAAGGDQQALADWTSTARQYIDLLRQHIQKEDQILFLMAIFTLLPVGFLQTWDSFQNGLWHARSSAFYERSEIQFIGQWRIIPDLIIIAGALCLVVFVVRAMLNLKPVGLADEQSIVLPSPEREATGDTGAPLGDAV